MALVTCPECAAPVSERAPVCPRCGAPIAARVEERAIGTSLTTTQRTSKRLKAQTLIFLACFIGGLIMFFTSAGTSFGIAAGGMLLVLVGIGGYIITKARIWWHHD